MPDIAGKAAEAVVITGAGGGIGSVTAKLFIERGYRVFGSVRSVADGERLRRELGPLFSPLIFDVRDEDGVRAAADTVRRALCGRRLAALINNAAACIPGPIAHQPLDEFRSQIETNLIGPFIVTKAFLGLLGGGRRDAAPGRVVNISSICGEVASPFASAYCASKHGLEAFSDALRRELLGERIAVVIVAPGLVRTPIWKKHADTALRQYEATTYSLPFRKAASIFIKTSDRYGMPPDDVAATVFEAVTARTPKLRYTPTDHPLVERYVMPMMPRWLLDLFVAHRFRLRRRAVPVALTAALAARPDLTGEPLHARAD